MIDTENAIVAVGNTFQFVNIFTGKYTWLRAIGDGGIGAIAVWFFDINNNLVLW